MTDPKKKRTPPFGGTSMSIPPPRAPLDSSPTPVIEMGYRDLSARLSLLSSRFRSQAFVYQKHPLKLDMKASKACEECADNLVSLAARIENWPNLSMHALAAEKSYISEQYLNYMDIAQSLLGEGKFI